MAGLGKKPIIIPQGVEIKILDSKVLVSGPKGKMERSLPSELKLKLEEGKLWIERSSDDSPTRALQGLIRALVQKMVLGVVSGFEKRLELSGVGYRAALQGGKLSLSLGFSHPVEVAPPSGVEFTVEGTNKIKISGMDWEAVGQIAANIRSLRPIEPYKGKGVKYFDEVVKRKAGKAAKAAGAAAAGA